MSYQVFARKWRPTNFDQVVGQEHVLRALRNALDRGVVHHAFLFTGTRGVGKTTLARIMARCFNCEQGPCSTPCGECNACREIDQGCHVDLIEVDAASKAKVEDTRDLMDNVSYAPISGRYRIYLIDEVHMFSNHSFNALLKVLEEPPDHIRFLLATTEPKRIPVTVLSRCIQFHLRALGVGEISRHIQHVLAEEKISCDAEAADLVAAAASGSLRDALSLLEQAVTDGEGELREDKVRTMIGTIPGTDLQALMQAVVVGDGKVLLDCLRHIAGKQPDFSMVLSDLMALLQKAAIAHLSGETETGVEESNPATRLSPEEIQLLYQIALHGRRDLALAPDPCGGFEMCMIRMLAFKPASEPVVGVALGSSESRGSHQRSIEPSGTAPSKAEPGRAEPSRTAPSRAEPSKADLSGAKLSKAEPSRAAPSRAEPSKAETNDAELEPVPDYWRDWIQKAGLSAMLKQLAYNCAVQSYDNDVLKLALPTSCKFLLSQQKELHQVLQEQVNSNLRLDINLEEHPTPTLAQWFKQEEQEEQDRARQQLDNDPNIRALHAEFGAVVQPESVKVEDSSSLVEHSGNPDVPPSASTNQ